MIIKFFFINNQVFDKTDKKNSYLTKMFSIFTSKAYQRTYLVTIIIVSYK
jgi:hypothetical protein